MLELHNVLWIIPGVIFIYLYNKRRFGDSISLSGWPYLFFLVVIASLTWLPAEFFSKETNLKINLKYARDVFVTFKKWMKSLGLYVQ